MGGGMDDIPIVDFSCYGLQVPDGAIVDPCVLQKLSADIYHAFSTIGFAYLKNHGIPQQKVEQSMRIGRQFFDLPEDEKEKFQKTDNKHVHGWVALRGEKLNSDMPADMKEMYNVDPGSAKIWPDRLVPGFQEELVGMFDTCTRLAHRVLEVIALSLDIKDREFFVKSHRGIKTPNNTTTLRLLHYPPLPENHGVKSGTVRLGEHSDYGTMTLLFQDEVGGLEVKRRDGVFIPATPIPGTILVNISDTMQRWTADRLVSTIHRVLVQDDDVRGEKHRQSMAFFVNPDNDTLVTCFDGSNKYPDRIHGDYLKYKFDTTYDK